MKASDLPKLAAPFPKEDIHWRAQTVTREGNKALALAYVDARDVMERLDIVCGPEGWQTEHADAGGGRLVCRIGILVDGEWIWKSDGAGATDVEADKGAFSDAFKRAAVPWGVARYLYGLGNTYVPCEAKDTGQKDNWGNIKWRFVKFTEDPWKYVRGADKLTWRGPLKVTELKANMTDLSAKMNGGTLATTGDLERVVADFAAVIDQAQTDLPDWWRGFDAKYKELQATLMVGPAQPHHQAAE